MASILKRLREEQSYTQKYVGDILGIGQNTYSKLESGQIRLTIDRVGKLADLYEVEPELILKAQLPVVNHNNGKFSKGIINAENYTEEAKENNEAISALKDKIIEEKEKQIIMLKEQIEEKNREICFWRELTSK